MQLPPLCAALNATRRMRDAIHALDRSAVYYLDAGNPTNQMKLYNPHAHHVPSMDACVAENADQLAWRWATELDGPNGATTPGNFRKNFRPDVCSRFQS